MNYSADIQVTIDSDGVETFYDGQDLVETRLRYSRMSESCQDMR